MTGEAKGCRELFSEVIDAGLCTLCGACTGGCPYLVHYRGRVALLDNCTAADGRCYTHCPRTYADLDTVSQKVFGLPFRVDGVGVAREMLLARSADPVIQQRGQDGGTVTGLLALALAERFIEGVVATRMSDDRVPHGVIARSRPELLECAGNSYEPSPVLERLNRIPAESNEKLAVVALPCQAFALGKMKTYAAEKSMNIDNVKLVIGLFCGWVLAEGFHRFMQGRFDLSRVVKFDIPHHPGHTLDVYYDSGKESVELDEIRGFVNPGCSSCWDMTAEFADISVGSGRARYRGWNTVIVRSETGAELMELARAKGTLETRPLPEENATHLKKVVLDKKKKALRQIIATTGDRSNLLYVGLPDEIVNRLLAE